MKKFLIPLAIALLLLGVGIYWLSRPVPRIAPPEATVAIFQKDQEGPSLLVRHGDPGSLRLTRWLPPLPGGYQFVQCLTQTGLQRLVLLKNGEMLWEQLLTRPSTVREGFFSQATLADAVLFDDVAVMLFKPSADGSEQPLVLALDVKTFENRWFFRGDGDRLTPNGPTGERAVYLQGQATLYRLSLNGKQGVDKNGLKQAVTIALPESVQNLSDLIPTGSHGLLVAHDKGLSARNAKGDWSHLEMPANLGPCTGSPKLAAIGATYYWQPFPGALVQVKADAKALQGWGATSFACPPPYDLDGHLLQLRGADASGNLWFSLASPTLQPPPPPYPAAEKPVSISPPAPQGGVLEALPEVSGDPNTTPSEPQWKEDTPASPGASSPPAPKSILPLPQDSPSLGTEAWATYAAKGLDRLYAWDAKRKRMKVYSITQTWKDMKNPVPTTLHGLKPEAGHIFVEGTHQCWLIPLDKLSAQVVK